MSCLLGKAKVGPIRAIQFGIEYQNYTLLYVPLILQEDLLQDVDARRMSARATCASTKLLQCVLFPAPPAASFIAPTSVSSASARWPDFRESAGVWWDGSFTAAVVDSLSLDASAEARPLGLLDEHESESLDELELELEDSSSLLELELLKEDSESDELLSELLDELLLDDELQLEAAPKNKMMS